MLKIDSNGTHLMITPPDMNLRIRGNRWTVMVPANATQVCETMDVDPLEIATMCGGTMANYWRIIYRDGSKSGLERNNPLKSS